MDPHGSMWQKEVFREHIATCMLVVKTGHGWALVCQPESEITEVKQCWACPVHEWVTSYNSASFANDHFLSLTLPLADIFL